MSESTPIPALKVINQEMCHEEANVMIPILDFTFMVCQCFHLPITLKYSFYYL